MSEKNEPDKFRMVPHYFLSNPAEPGDYFCFLCGKYLTDEMHFRANDERKLPAPPREEWK